MKPEELFDRYYARLCVFAKQLLGDDEKAEDVVQDVFVKLCEQQETFPTRPDEIKRYLYVVVRNGCYKVLRHEKVVDNYQHLNENETFGRPEILHKIIHAEVMNTLSKAIETLPKGCALILKKSYFDGLSNQLIAEELNLSIHTVKSQKKRAIALLRDRLNPDMQLLLITLFIYLGDY